MIEVLFLDQSRSISAGDWNVAFQSCSSSYRSRREVERFTEDVGTVSFEIGHCTCEVGCKESRGDEGTR